MRLTQIAAILFASLSLFSAAAEDVTVESPKIETEAARDREKRLRQEERAKALLEKKPILYSGFLVDAARAEKKSKLFSLRSPRDPKNDYKNIAIEERTSRPRAGGSAGFCAVWRSR